MDNNFQGIPMQSLPPTLEDLLRSGPCHGVLATTNAGGDPHSSVATIMGVDDHQNLYLALSRGNGNLENLRQRPAISMTIAAGQDQVYTISGQALVVREPMHSSPVLALARVQVTRVRPNSSPILRVTGGISTSWRSPKGEVFQQQVLAEVMEECAAGGSINVD